MQAALSRLHRSRWLALIPGLLWVIAPPPESFAQCNPDASKVYGTVGVADGSTPPVSTVTVVAVQDANPNGEVFMCLGCPWGSIGVSLGLPGAYKFKAGSSGYMWNPLTGSATCSRDPVTNCLSCSGGFGIGLYSIYGSYSGHVTQLPERTPVAGALVSAFLQPSDSGIGGKYTDSNGYYTFSFTTEPERSNNWGVTVYGDGGAPLTATYRLTSSTTEESVFRRDGEQPDDGGGPRQEGGRHGERRPLHPV